MDWWAGFRWGLLVISIWVLSALIHEHDLARNFNKTGDAHALVFQIK